MTYIETVKRIWKRDPTTLIQMSLMASISYTAFSLIDKSFKLQNFIFLLLLTWGASFVVTIIIHFFNKRKAFL